MFKKFIDSLTVNSLLLPLHAVFEGSQFSHVTSWSFSRVLVLSAKVSTAAGLNKGKAPNFVEIAAYVCC